MKKKLVNVFVVLVGLYVLMCGLLYFIQEKLLFLPQKLAQHYQYDFDTYFKELNFKMDDGAILNGLLFPAPDSKGLVFYLHGNAGALHSYGHIAKTYISLNYDVFMFDYRSYGKSTGTINGKDQLFTDNQFIYNALKKKYDENNIVVLGYSIGTGLAAKLASENNPGQLILQAPYYNLTDLVKQKMPIVPSFILKYKFKTNQYLQHCNMPITIFHGDKDKTIYYGSSIKLKEELKDKIDFIPLEGQRHMGITENKVYQSELKTILDDL